jgi:hypothetical protein
MQFIDIQSTGHGFFLDPTRYLDRLERCGDQLPPGAAAFARDPGHYEFGDRCLKSLVLDSASIEPHEGGTGARLVFRAFAGDGAPILVVRYVGVTEFSMTFDTETASNFARALPGHREVLLDEILPAASGCSHEIRLVSGTILISCRDLEAEWCGVPLF